MKNVIYFTKTFNYNKKMVLCVKKKTREECADQNYDIFKLKKQLKRKFQIILITLTLILGVIGIYFNNNSNRTKNETNNIVYIIIFLIILVILEIVFYYIYYRNGIRCPSSKNKERHWEKLPTILKNKANTLLDIGEWVKHNIIDYSSDCIDFCCEFKITKIDCPIPQNNKSMEHIVEYFKIFCINIRPIEGGTDYYGPIGPYYLGWDGKCFKIEISFKLGGNVCKNIGGLNQKYKYYKFGKSTIDSCYRRMF